jgi:hypothetical protein
MSNSFIVQQALNFSVGAATVSATFPKALTANNPILVSLMAIDTGAAVPSTASGVPYITLTDTQNNTLSADGGATIIWGDNTDGISILSGNYTVSALFSPPGGNDTLTFVFAPISSAVNCLVGIAAYELSDVGNTFAGAVEDSASSPSLGTNNPVAGNLTGGINYASAGAGVNGTLFIVQGGVLTNNGAVFAPGPGASGDPAFSFGGTTAVTLNGKKIAVGAQFCLSPQFSPPSAAQNFNTGFANSAVSSIISGGGTGFGTALGNVPLTQQATPIYSPAPGSYASAQSVTLASAGATAIYYTIDGSTPTTGSTLYTGAITVSSTTTIKALAVGSGVSNSAIIGGTFTISVTTYSISGNAGVASALVSYTSLSSGSGSTTADGSGNYTLSGLPNDTYTITPSLASYTFSPASASETVSGNNVTGVNFTAKSPGSHYSVPDCRLKPNTAVNVNGTETYTVQTSDNAAIPPVDSRKAGAPVVSGTYPQNSRAPGTYGSGE